MADAIVRLDQDAGLSLQGLRVGADIQGHMRRILLWYYDARGLVALGGVPTGVGSGADDSDAP